MNRRPRVVLPPAVGTVCAAFVVLWLLGPSPPLAGSRRRAGQARHEYRDPRSR